MRASTAFATRFQAVPGHPARGRAYTWLALLAAALMLSGCAGMGEGGPPHPGAVNPYSSGGFHDAGPNYPDTGI